MNNMFKPQLILLGTSITPGRSTNVDIGTETEYAETYVDPATGMEYTYYEDGDSGPGFYDENFEVYFPKPQNGWEIVP